MMFIRKVTGAIFILLVILSAVFLWSQRWDIADWWRLRDYTPSPTVTRLATQTTMTDYGRRLFYVHDPQIIYDVASFRSSCTVAEASIVLGCYISNQGIYIYDVRDERLDGIKQVTAAHEMLHAAYDRLSRSERERIDGLTQEYFATLQNERIQETIAAYRARDPSVVANELHSILPTEVESLPEELEVYYQQYFYDRQVIVAFARQYEEAFEGRRRQIEQYDLQLKQLSQQIEASSSNLTRQRAQLESEQNRLEALVRANRIDEYNSAVAGFNQLVAQYNSSVEQLQGVIDRYNKIVESRNAIAVEENELATSIDNRLEKIQSE
jgi:hypothetical protein